MTKTEFLGWETASRDIIDFKRCYCDLARDLIGGLILSQIVFWHLPAKDGQPKLHVVDKDGRRWLAKNHADWWDEVRASPKQAATALKRLWKAGLIDLHNGMFNSKKTPMIALCWEPFLEKLDKVVKVQSSSSIVTKSHNRSYRKGAIGRDERARPITETTASDYPKRRAGEERTA